MLIARPQGLRYLRCLNHFLQTWWEAWILIPFTRWENEKCFRKTSGPPLLFCWRLHIFLSLYVDICNNRKFRSTEYLFCISLGKTKPYFNLDSFRSKMISFRLLMVQLFLQKGCYVCSLSLRKAWLVTSLPSLKYVICKEIREKCVTMQVTFGISWALLFLRKKKHNWFPADHSKIEFLRINSLSNWRFQLPWDWVFLLFTCPQSLCKRFYFSGQPAGFSHRSGQLIWPLFQYEMHNKSWCPTDRMWPFKKSYLPGQGTIIYYLIKPSWNACFWAWQWLEACVSLFI